MNLHKNYFRIAALSALLISTGCATIPSGPNFSLSMQPAADQKIVSVAGSNNEQKYLSKSGGSIVSLKKIRNSTTDNFDSNGYGMWELEIAVGNSEAVRFNPGTDMSVVIDGRSTSSSIVKVGYMREQIADLLTPSRPQENLYAALGTSLGGLIASKNAQSYADIQRTQAKQAEMKAQQAQIYQQKLMVWEQQKIQAYDTAKSFSDKELSSRKIKPNQRHSGTFLMSNKWHQYWDTADWEKGTELKKDVVFRVKIGNDIHNFNFKSVAS